MISEGQAQAEGVVLGGGLIDEDAVAAFAAAVNDNNPRYYDGRAVPPLYTAGVIIPEYHEAQSAWQAAVDVRDYSTGVHGQHDVYFSGPVIPGSYCRWTVGPRSGSRTRGGALVTVIARITDLAGNLLVEHLWSTFYPGGHVSNEVGEKLPDHTFPESARNSLVASRTLEIDRDQGFRYGGATGDRSSHSINDDAAREQGHPGKILQGMCTFSMACGFLVESVADGDPGRVARIAVRFSAPTRPSGQLTVDVFDAGRSEAGSRVFAFEASQAGAPVLRHGRIELR